jgi:pimeloyl-ACP methyl ester carboxylesterase
MMLRTVRLSALALVLAMQGTVVRPVAVAAAVLGPGTIGEALERYAAARARIDVELGTEGAANFHRRLFDDLERQQTPPPDGYPTEDWAETVAAIARLDLDAVDQLVTGAAAPLRATPGLHEMLVPSRVDRVWQLVAVYVPASLKASAPLAMVLHGNPQTESELLGQPWLRRLADRTGTILVAPYGRGIYDYAEPAATDVYDLLSAVQAALPVDRGRTFLAGYSMGGFSVFKIGPRGGYRWSAVLCVSGAILNSGVRPVSIAWSDMRVYVVTGADDTSIPTKYGEQTAGFLAGMGLPVSFYEEPRGSHALRTLVPSLQRAWDDMHAGLVRPDSVPVSRSGFAVPRSAPVVRTPS